MGLNLKKLGEVQKELKERCDGSSGFLRANKDLKPDADIRILPPLSKLNGVYFFEEKGYWIDGVRYISPSSFGEDCPIDEVVQRVREKNDDILTELLKNRKRFKKSSVFYIPILHLKCEYNDKNELKNWEVVGGKPKIFQCSVTMIMAINKLATSRVYQNGTEDGMFDRVKGFNIIVSREGEGLDTEYSAQGWRESMEMPKKYYKEIPDVMDMVKKKLVPNKKLKKVAEKYFFGKKKKKKGLDEVLPF